MGVLSRGDGRQPKGAVIALVGQGLILNNVPPFEEAASLGYLHILRWNTPEPEILEVRGDLVTPLTLIQILQRGTLDLIAAKFGAQPRRVHLAKQLAMGLGGLAGVGMMFFDSSARDFHRPLNEKASALTFKGRQVYGDAVYTTDTAIIGRLEQKIPDHP